MEDTLKSLFDLDTNITMKYLTIFSAFMMPLTLATSFFGMNTESGHFDNYWIIGILIITTIISLSSMILFFIKRKK